jgi:predicted ABC-type transport system involved in lysophospholipase L1 biosynthesis ATPase subunit
MPDIVLACRGLAKAYRTPAGELPVLRGVDLELARGEVVAVTGESGAGKTTLLQVLGGLDVPDAGELAWQGRAVARLPAAERARLRSAAMGFVFQNYQLMPELDARENVALAARIRGRGAAESLAAADRLLAAVGLAGRGRHLPSALSGGECQRVALARALVNRPALLLADEPTGNLDEASGAAVMDLLLSLARADGAAVLLITHSAAHAARADRRLALSGGTLRPA